MWIRDDTAVNVVQAMVSNFVRSVQTEMETHAFFRVPKEELHLFQPLQVSQAAANAFPSAVREMADAGRCLAFDQPTASVLHAMRALEIPLGALVKELNFTPSNPNWQVVINECEREIRIIRDKDLQEFYSEAACNFLYFKNAWRNHAMHGRDTMIPGKPGSSSHTYRVLWITYPNGSVNLGATAHES